jgi:ribosomal protein L37AE/L43A
MGDIIIDEDRRVMWDCWNDVVKYYNIVERFHCCSKCNSEYNRVTNRDNKLIAYCENCKHKVESETTEELINMWNSETV